VEGNVVSDQPQCTVIGAGPGIGLAVARRFAAEGFSVGLISRDELDLSALAAKLPSARYAVADAGDEAALTPALRKFGPASVLVYNVSAGRPGLPTSLERAGLIADFDVNVGGLLVAVRETVPAMRIAGKGSIFITGGGLALTPMAQLSAVSVGKAAQRSLAFSLAEELEPAGIHVATVTVCGFVRPGTHFDPDTIAGEYWRLHTQPAGAFEREVIYK
jgi:NAD(P)-dependent dehydrogenase (short-subunit alcohol dehydrogenase family)